MFLFVLCCKKKHVQYPIIILCPSDIYIFYFIISFKDNEDVECFMILWIDFTTSLFSFYSFSVYSLYVCFMVKLLST